MAAWTRRGVLAGIGGTTAVGWACGEEEARPSGPPLVTRVRTDLMAGGTLFRPKEGDLGPAPAFGPTPAWFRQLPALYCPAPRTAGCALMPFAEGSENALSRRIRHFSQLPELLEDARRLGTDLVYLVDPWEGAPGDDPAEYCWRKGDYVPRADMGGAAALRDGIDAVHRAGGRIMFYLEPFVINHGTEIGKARGREWSIETADGIPEQPYPDDWKICPACRPAVAHLVGVARRMVGELGADAIHLDSAGFESGWRCVATGHGHPLGDPRVFDDGMAELVAALRRAATEENPEAVVMCEGPTMRRLFQSVSASQDWGIHTLVNRWAWNQAGRTSVFTAGWSLDDLHQVVALGHKLSLGATYWLQPPPDASARAFLDDHLPNPIPTRPDERFRRYFAETFMRALHRWRNGGILAGRPVPNLDEVTPRRWIHPEDFVDQASLVRTMGEIREAAVHLDAALGPDGVAKQAPTDHVARLCKARRALGARIEGSTTRALSSTDPEVAAWAFDGGVGAAVSAVSVSNEPRVVKIPATADLVDLDDGSRVPPVMGTATVHLAPHTVRLFAVG